MNEVPQKSRRTRAQQVVDKAKRENAERGDVQDLPSTRIERRLDNGKQTLAAIFANNGGGQPDRLDLSFLIEFPGLTDVFAEGLLTWGKTRKQCTRISVARMLRNGWFTYLAQEGIAETVLSQINEQVIKGFKIWLQQRAKADGQPFHPSTIRAHLGGLRTLLRHTHGAAELREMVPTGAPGAWKKANPTETLQFGDLLKVMTAVEKEILALRNRWEEGRRLLEQGRQYLEQGQTLCPNPRRRVEARAEANIALALAMIDARYSGVIPDRVVIKADDPLLDQTICFVITSEKASGYFYPSTRDLVPLVLSIAIATVFNPGTVMNLCWKNIDRNVDRLSDGRASVQFDVRDDEDDEQVEKAEASRAQLTKITGDKPRARRQLVRLLDPEASGADQCPRRSKSEPPCRSNIEPGLVADQRVVSCG